MNCPFCEVPMVFVGGGHDPYSGKTVEDFFCPLCGFEFEVEL